MVRKIIDDFGIIWSWDGEFLYTDLEDGWPPGYRYSAHSYEEAMDILISNSHLALSQLYLNMTSEDI